MRSQSESDFGFRLRGAFAASLCAVLALTHSFAVVGWAQTPVIPPAVTELAPVRVEVQRVQASGGAASLPGFVDVGSPRRGFAN